jgi:hypothetical protein
MTRLCDGDRRRSRERQVGSSARRTERQPLAGSFRYDHAMAYGRARRASGNAAMASGLFIVATLIASRWMDVGWSQRIPGWFLDVAAGQVQVGHWSSMGGPVQAGWSFRLSQSPSGPHLLYANRPNSYLGLVAVNRLNGFGVVGTRVGVLPMIPAICLVIAGFALKRWGRRALRLSNDVCAVCGYAVLGLAPGAKCPECGNLPKRAATGVAGVDVR